LAGLVGCNELSSEEAGTESVEGASRSTSNGLAQINGLAFTNGLAMINGLANTNGLALINGLASVNGLASTNGLMTTTMGRRTVSYMAKCALSSSQNLVKADQNGHNFTYAGGLNLAPNWLNSAPSPSDENLVSACLMAHLNTAGMHVP